MLSCLDENGLAVDSWVSLAQNQGYNYYWHDSLKGFTKSLYNLTQTVDGNIMATVNQLYSPTLDLDNIAWRYGFRSSALEGTNIDIFPLFRCNSLYNDDPPPPEDTASSTYAHAKGVILTDEQQGFWLIHSKPNWPGARNVGAMPFPDTTYAQSLMCITLHAESFNSIAEANMVNYPYIYDSFISAQLAVIIPKFAEWITGGKSTLSNVTNVFTSAGGVNYTQFAKSKAWGKDLYEDFVAPVLNRDLNVETWRLGSGGRMGSICESGNDDTWMVHQTEYDVFEVAEVSMPDGASWLGTEDHSKWVSTVGNISTTYVCVGDINRMCSQEKRGGGTVCVNNASVTLWESFDTAIQSVEDCWEYNPCDGSSSKCYWCPLPEPTLVPAPFPTGISEEPTGAPYPIITGDVAVILFDTDNPDMFTLVALYPIPPGTELKITDDGWTGSAFRGGEGIVSFLVTSTIPAGYVWTYAGPGTIDVYGDWTAVSGSFSMSTDSDQLFVYVGNEADPVFVFGLSTGPWVTDGTDIGTTNSVCPESLTEGGVNGSIAFSIVDNGAYYGPQLGTKNELLASICNSQNWLTSDSRYFYPNSTEFIVIDSTDAPTEQPASGSGASNKAVDVYGSLGKSGFVGLIVAIIVLFIMAAAFGVRQYLWKGKGLLSAMEN